MSNHDTTITTFVTVPTTLDSSDIGGSDGGDDNNSKLIGGLVGSIGGTIVIGSLVLLFLFLRKRRRNNVKNQNPDLNDPDGNSSDEILHKKYGFKKLFGSKATTNSGDVTGFEHVRGYDQEDDDFEYRGVTNNNLDSIFRSQNNSGAATTYYGSTHSQNTGQNSHTSRYNSIAYPKYTQVAEEDEQFNFGDGPIDEEQTQPYPVGTPSIEESDSDIENLHVNRNDIFGDSNASNNSRSRFTEEIV